MFYAVSFVRIPLYKIRGEKKTALELSDKVIQSEISALPKAEKYDEALDCYNKAGKIGTYFCDELYCKASLYEDLGDYEKAYTEYMKLSDILRNRGYDVEADAAEKDAEEVKKKIEK